MPDQDKPYGDYTQIKATLDTDKLRADIRNDVRVLLAKYTDHGIPSTTVMSYIASIIGN